MLILGQEVMATCHSADTMSNFAQLADGRIAKQRLGADWKSISKWKEHVPKETWIERFRTLFKEGTTLPGLVEHPTVEQMMAWEYDGVSEATDGCQVEPDGQCPHGCKSWGSYFF